MEIIKRKRLLENYRSREVGVNYGEVTASTIDVPIYLTQTYEDIGIYTDTFFIPFDDNYNGLFKLNRQDIEVPEKFDHAIHGRHPLKTAEDYNQYVTNIRGTMDDRHLWSVSSYGVDENGNPLFVTLLNMAKEIELYCDTVLKIDGSIIEYVLGGQVDGSGNYIPGTGTIYKSDLSKTIVDPLTGKRWYETVFNHTVGGLRTIDSNGLEANASLNAIYKEEELLKVVEPPKVRNRVFISRGGEDIFERHAIMSEIKTRNDIDEYRDGYF